MLSGRTKLLWAKRGWLARFNLFTIHIDFCRLWFGQWGDLITFVFQFLYWIGYGTVQTGKQDSRLYQLIDTIVPNWEGCSPSSSDSWHQTSSWLDQHHQLPSMLSFSKANPCSLAFLLCIVLDCFRPQQAALITLYQTVHKGSLAALQPHDRSPSTFAVVCMALEEAFKDIIRGQPSRRRSILFVPNCASLTKDTERSEAAEK